MKEGIRLSMIDHLRSILNAGANPALRYQNSLELIEHLAYMIVQQFETKEDLLMYLPRIETLILQQDYRLVGEYLAALRRGNQEILSIFERLCSSNSARDSQRERYRLAYAHFTSSVQTSLKADVVLAPSLDDVFTAMENQLVIYFYDQEYKIRLMQLIDLVGSSLDKFMEHQYDIPGLNAVVRQGLVRKWYLPDGTPIVSKRDNPHKNGRFRREQDNYVALSERFGSKSAIAVRSNDPTDNFLVQIARPFAVIYDGYSDRFHALSIYEDSVSLEDVLLTEQNSESRDRLLRHYRRILDMLYEYGVLWGDMSPRNILIKKQAHITTYVLIDFEKTFIFDDSIPEAQRRDHCRGQICVEEFGVLCSQEELLTCFNGYFDPSRWDLKSTLPLSFKPRPEIMDIVHGRNMNQITLGEYNSIDKDVMAVRMPYTDPRTRERRFPGHLGFKVEHYLSCAGYATAGDYDCKTTEILIFAKKQGCFYSVVTLLADVVIALESSFLKSEFVAILQNGKAGNMVLPQKELRDITQILDMFYEMGPFDGSYQRLIAQFNNVNSG